MDTIVYKIHNASHYPFLIPAIDVIKHKGKSKIEFEKGSFINPNVTDFETAFANIQLNQFRWVSPVSKVRIPSYQSEITVQHLISDDIIRFEYSIPKFYMSNNVCEIIPSLGSKWSRPDKFGMIDLCLDYWYKIIRTSIHHVIFCLTSGLDKVSNFDIEIFRFDIAFNQIFESKEDALFYNDAQKKARIPKSAESNFVPFATAITCKNDRFYFKIYHKGSEFSKNCYKPILKKYEVEKIRTRTMKLSYDCIDQLQDYADKILRYELECKSSLMSYLFNQNLKKLFHKKYRLYFSVLDSIFRDNRYQVILDSTFYFKPDGSFDFLYKPSDEKYKSLNVTELNRLRSLVYKSKMKLIFFKNKFQWSDKKCFAMWKWYQSEQGKEHAFFLDVETKRADKCIDLLSAVSKQKVDKNTGEIYNDIYGGFDIVELFETSEKNQKFSKPLLKLMIEKHNQFFGLFQFQSLPDYSKNVFSNILTLDQINNQRAIKDEPLINDSHLKKIMLLLDKFGTFDAIKKEGICDNRTILRWKKTIEEVTQSKFNFVANNFVDSICTQFHTMYEDHYKHMYVNSTPLSKFLNISYLQI